MIAGSSKTSPISESGNTAIAVAPHLEILKLRSLRLGDHAANKHTTGRLRGCTHHCLPKRHGPLWLETRPADAPHHEERSGHFGLSSLPDLIRQSIFFTK
jgi:hypothetical protein